MKKILQTAFLALLLALAVVPAWALGLGQLQLKSKLGEPLLAEIPVISADPTELENLQARLAAPDTFLRVGLPLPDKMVSDLRFLLLYDAAGKPVIQVTSPGPVAMPMLTFLLEVDWGDGRLVREYSVLLAQPEAVAAAAQPEIQAPVAAPSNTIVREAPKVSARSPQPQPMAAAKPARVSVARQANAAVAASAGTRHVVRAGDSLSAIAAQIRGPGQSMPALMAALLHANPQAFIDNNPNLLRRGASLALPGAQAIAQASADGSAAALQQQLAGWRGARGAARTEAVDVANARTPSSAPARTATPRRVRDARLEITPAAASATTNNGTRSGTGGEGEAEMTQQLQEARETIATRDAEVAELKSRVAELESLQKQQSQLVQMRDGQLAAAQQQLQQRQQTAPTTAPSAATDRSAWPMALAIGVPLLLVLALGAWWMRRRRPQTTIAGEPSFAKAAPVPIEPALHEARPSTNANLFPAGPAAPPANAVTAAAASAAPANPLRKPSWMGVVAKGDVLMPEPGASSPQPSPAFDPSRTAAPSFASNNRAVMPDSVPSIRHEPMPRELPPGLGVFDAPAEDAVPPEPALAHHAPAIPRDERIALANTYLELDDESTARRLLQEVIDENGASATEARRLMGQIGPPS